MLKDIYNKVYTEGKETFHTFPLTDVYMEVLHFIEPYVKDKVIVDLGCGDGEFEECLVDAQPKKVIGIDYSTEAIKKAKDRNLDADFMCFDFIKDDISYLKADIVVSIGVIEHLEDPEAMFRIASQILDRGGLLIIEHPHFMNIRGVIWKTAEILFDLQMSKTDLHTIMPSYIKEMANKYKFNIEFHNTFRGDVAFGKRMVIDLMKRFKALKIDDDKIFNLTTYLSELIREYPYLNMNMEGSEIIWRLKKL